MLKTEKVVIQNVKKYFEKIFQNLWEKGIILRKQHHKINLILM